MPSLASAFNLKSYFALTLIVPRKETATKKR